MLKACLLVLLATAGLLALPAGGKAAPEELRLSRTCTTESSGNLVVTFYWEGGGASLAQWIEVGPHNSGWLSGTYTAFGPLSPVASRFAAGGFTYETTYALRIVQLLPDGSWDVSPTFYFETGYCAPPPAPAPCILAVCGVEKVSGLVVTGYLPGDAYDCEDFATYAEAREYFLAVPGDPSDLDADDDNFPCEDLPGAPQPANAT